jgi:hypothetical protein
MPLVSAPLSLAPGNTISDRSHRRPGKPGRVSLCSSEYHATDGTRPAYLSPYFYDQKTHFGIIGLAPRSLFSQNLAKDVQGLVLLDEVEATLAAVAELRKKGARLIGLSAGGIAWGAAPDAPDSLLAEALLSIDGIDQYWFGSASPDLADGMHTVTRNGK